MADSSLKAPLSSNQEQIRRELLPREWSAALVLDYLSKSEYGGELTQRTLAIGNATYNLQVTVEGLALDLAVLEVDAEAHISANSAHGATGSIVGRLDYCTTTAGGVVLQASSVADADDTAVHITTADIGPPGGSHSGSYSQQQTDLINELKAAVNQLASDLNSAITTLNNSLSTERTAKQREL